MLKGSVLLIALLFTAGCGGGEAQPAQSPVSPQPSVAATSRPTASSPQVSVSPTSPDKAAVSPAPAATQTPKQLVEAAGAKAVIALKDKDMAALAALVHPDKGVRFSPYSYVDTKQDLNFTAEQTAKLAGDQTPKTWGSYDGSGEPIKLTFAAYYDKFLYNHDYAKAEKISYNQTLGKGNTASNLKEIYPDANYMEYYYSGFDPQLEGMDWAGLTLVFEPKGGNWYLVGIVSSRWTI